MTTNFNEQDEIETSVADQLLFGEFITGTYELSDGTITGCFTADVEATNTVREAVNIVTQSLSGEPVDYTIVKNPDPKNYDSITYRVSAGADFISLQIIDSYGGYQGTIQLLDGIEQGTLNVMSLSGTILHDVVGDVREVVRYFESQMFQNVVQERHTEEVDLDDFTFGEFEPGTYTRSGEVSGEYTIPPRHTYAFHRVVELLRTYVGENHAMLFADLPGNQYNTYSAAYTATSVIFRIDENAVLHRPGVRGTMILFSPNPLEGKVIIVNGREVNFLDDFKRIVKSVQDDTGNSNL